MREVVKEEKKENVEKQTENGASQKRTFTKKNLQQKQMSQPRNLEKDDNSNGRCREKNVFLCWNTINKLFSEWNSVEFHRVSAMGSRPLVLWEGRTLGSEQAAEDSALDVSG